MRNAPESWGRSNPQHGMQEVSGSIPLGSTRLRFRFAEATPGKPRL
jgi:hypothetical protein